MRCKEMSEAERIGESNRLFAPQLIPFRPRSIEKLGRKLIRAKEPPWISTDCEAPHRQNESTWEKGLEPQRQSGCQQKPHCSAAGTGWQETRDSDQTESFGEFAFTARSASQVPDKTEQIKASTSESKLAL